MAANLSITEAAQRLGLTERAVRKRCASGRLPGARRVGRTWRIPVSADPRLAETPVKETPDGADLDAMKAVNVKKQEAALRRLGLIKEAEKFCRLAARDGIGRTDALRHFATQHGLAFRTLQRWIRAYDRDGIAGLIDKRRGTPGHGQPFSLEAQKRLKQLYLHGNKRDLTTCWNIVVYEGKKNKWQVPSYDCVRRWVNENIPMPARVLYREGEAAYTAKCEPYILKDWDSIPPGSVWVGDHHQLNVWVRHRGRWIRPWITAWMDMRSRKVMGHFLAPSPNQGTILQALRRGVLEHGLPDSVKIDNGRDYDSQLFTGTTKQKRRRVLKKGALEEAGLSGLFNQLSIDVSFALPYHAKSKSIERFFDTLDRQLCKSIPTYCGKDTAQKPQDLNAYLKDEAALAEAFTIPTLALRLDRWIAAYDNLPHKGEGMNGATPNEVFATRTSKRMAKKDSLDLLLRVWSQPLKVGKNGVRFRHMYYGQYNERLVRYQGRSVRVSYDPDDLRRVHVYDAETWEFLTVAEQADFVRYGAVKDEDLREAMKEKARATRVVRKEAGSAGRRRHARITDLAIEAMNDRTRPEPENAAVDVQPVATPIDGQAKTVRREERRQVIKRAVQRAAGAEGTDIGGIEVDMEALYAANHPGLGQPILGIPGFNVDWDEPEPREFGPWPELAEP